MNVGRLHPTSARIASRRLNRAVSLLCRAGQQLDDAASLAPDKFHRNRLYVFASGLRDLAIPLARIASHLQRGDS
jgi:hypothetical protein